jgi:hypothetical protein
VGHRCDDAATTVPAPAHLKAARPAQKNENDKAAEAAFGAAIAEAIDQLVRLRGMKKTAARRLVAATLSDIAFRNTFAAAQKLTDPATRRFVHQGEWKAVEAARSRLGRVLRKIDK